MKEEWLMWWSWKFLKIAFYQLVFSWQFFFVVFLITACYMALVYYQGEKLKQIKQTRHFLRFSGKEMAFFAVISLLGIFVAGTLGISITLHANAFAAGMDKGCVESAETESSYEFRLSEDCDGDRNLLWNKVDLNKTEGEDAFIFLKNLKH